MTDDDPDTPMRMVAFEHVRRLSETHDNLTANELKPGFVFQGERIPLINPQRGIFKPKQMRFLLSIKTVFPKPGGKVWYDAHRQIFEGDETRLQRPLCIVGTAGISGHMKRMIPTKLDYAASTAGKVPSGAWFISRTRPDDIRPMALSKFKAQFVNCMH